MNFIWEILWDDQNDVLFVPKPKLLKKKQKKTWLNRHNPFPPKPPMRISFENDYRKNESPHKKRF